MKFAMTLFNVKFEQPPEIPKNENELFEFLSGFYKIIKTIVGNASAESHVAL